MFEVKQFNSGEYDIKLIDRLSEYEVVIHWNWFKEKDLFVILQKIACIKQTYGDKRIILKVPYFPYARQDRVFEAGQAIPFITLLDILHSQVNDITTMALHAENYRERFYNETYISDDLLNNYNIVFPDAHAYKHFDFEKCKLNDTNINNLITLNKFRSKKGIELITSHPTSKHINSSKTFLICDDICDGGRTFIECAKFLKEKYGNNIIVELMVYHGFMTHGLDDLKAAGISKIHILNPDSYEYLIDKFPNDVNYFKGDYNV